MTSENSEERVALPAVDVLVVAVTYNSARVVGGMLESLPAAMRGCTWRLVTADNNSADGTPAVLRELMPDGVHLAMGRNAGYSAGINAALAAGGRSSAALVLNPDIRLEAGSALTLLASMRRHAGAIVVPRLLDADGTLMYSLRREPNIRRSLGDTLLGAQRAGLHREWGEVVTIAAEYDRESSSDWATGAAMLLSRECLDACGAWDETFFLYSEETEYCLRARDCGFELVLAPEVSATHLGGESRVSPKLHALLVVNRVRLYARTHSRVQTAAFWLVAIAREASRSVIGQRASRLALLTLLSPRRMRDVAAQARN